MKYLCMITCCTTHIMHTVISAKQHKNIHHSQTTVDKYYNNNTEQNIKLKERTVKDYLIITIPCKIDNTTNF